MARIHPWNPIVQSRRSWSCGYHAGCSEDPKAEHGEGTKAYFRQDNAGCYHSSCSILACPAIAESTGVQVIGIDFSDPQGGKGAADRLAAKCKGHVRVYINEGKDRMSVPRSSSFPLRHRRSESSCNWQHGGFRYWWGKEDFRYQQAQQFEVQPRKHYSLAFLWNREWERYQIREAIFRQVLVSYIIQCWQVAYFWYVAITFATCPRASPPSILDHTRVRGCVHPTVWQCIHRFFFLLSSMCLLIDRFLPAYSSSFFPCRSDPLASLTLINLQLT